MFENYASLLVAGFLWSGCIVGLTQLAAAIWNIPKAGKIGLPLALGAITGLFLSQPVLATIGVEASTLGAAAFFGLGAGTGAHTVYAVFESRIKKEG